MNLMQCAGPTFVLVITAAVGCSSDGGATTGNDSNVTSGAPCVVKNEITGKDMTQEELKKLDDPVSRFLLTSSGCPDTVTEIMAKFVKEDTANCAPAAAGKPATGVTTRAISEASALSQKAGSYRNVTNRTCGGRQKWELLTSGSLSGQGLQEGFLELIAADKTKGVFDYYSQEDGRWTFFGSSSDFVESGYDCKLGTCQPKIGKQTRCATCHPGGGLNMKELHTPWVSWDQGNVPGAQEAIAKFPEQLGSRELGEFLEFNIVIPGNKQWVKKRLELMKAKGTQEVLRPLFCTVDINLQTSSSQPEALTSVPSSFFIDRSFRSSQVPIDNADYKALLASTASTLPGGKKDTPFGFVYPERSQQDLDYQAEIGAGIVDDDFIKDVLSVDFTRPAFSVARCDLLKFAPTLAADKMSPDAIRDGFKTALANETGAAAVQLLANLNAVADQAAHQTEIDAFFAACKARPKKDMLTDVMKWISHLRRTVRQASPIIEFEATLPSDNQSDVSGAFDPKTCELK